MKSYYGGPMGTHQAPSNGTTLDPLGLPFPKIGIRLFREARASLCTCPCMLNFGPYCIRVSLHRQTAVNIKRRLSRPEISDVSGLGQRDKSQCTSCPRDIQGTFCANASSGFLSLYHSDIWRVSVLLTVTEHG